MSIQKVYWNQATQPFKEVAETWALRSDRLRQATLEGLCSVIDTSTYLTRAGLGIAYGVSSILRSQLTERIDEGFQALKWQDAPRGPRLLS